MFDTFSRAGEKPLEFIICILLALIPVVVWYLIFRRKHANKWLFVILTFVAGMMAGALILAYQYFWGQSIGLVFFSVTPENFSSNIQAQFGVTVLSYFLIYLSVGFIEEYAKHWVVKKADERIFESVDDVIEFSIIAALGFSFLENIGYFFMVILRDDMETLPSLFLVRSVFVVFIHILCSGIYGYYYGLGHFASPVLAERQRQGKLAYIPEFVHRITHLKRATVFREEMATFGLLIAMTLHGLYDFLLEMETIGNLASYFTDAPVPPYLAEIRFHVVMLPIMLIGGYLYLMYLLRKKEDQEEFGQLKIREEYVPLKH